MISEYDKRSFHEALDKLFKNTGHVEGTLSAITLRMRYDSKVGSQVHATVNMTQRFSALVNVFKEDAQ